MTAPITVRVEGGSAIRRLVAEVIATLPTSFRSVHDRAEVVALDGAENWVERGGSALTAGARGIVVIDPGDRDASTLLAASQRLGSPVLLDTPWAHNPVVPAAAAEFARHLTADGLMEATVVSRAGRPVLDALPAQLALVRAITGPVATARLVAAGDHGYAVLGTDVSGMRLRMASVETDAVQASAELRFIGRSSSVEVVLPGAETAQPARLTVTTPDGATVKPTIFENARRSGWRALHAALTTGDALHDLEGFVDDSTIIAALAAELTTRNASHRNQRRYAR